MSVLMRWDGFGLTSATAFIPGTTGRTDINAFNSEQSSFQNPYTIGFPNSGSIVVGASTTISSRTNVPNLVVRDNAFGLHTRPYMGFDSAKAYSGAPAGPFSTYSLRYYFKHAAVSPNNDLGTIAFWAGSGGPHWNGLCLAQSTGSAIIPGLIGPVGGSLINQWIRVEIQVNTSFSPKIDVRWYAGDSTTLLGRFSPNPTSLTASQFLLIGEAITSNTVNNDLSLANMEFCNTYDLDGKFPGGTASASTVTNSSGTGTPVAAYTFPADLSNGTIPTASFTTFTNQTYASFLRTYTLYVPNGAPANPSGFPLVVWSHAGFFIGGYKEDLPAHWRNTLLNAGYAVATIRYLKSSFDTNAPYDSWGANDPLDSNTPAFGRYPSWIVDYKLAAVRIAAKCSTASGGDNTFAKVDGSRLFATGYSAGGYISVGAAVSKGLTNDGSSRNLTIAGNTTYSDGYTGADPTFLGTFSYAGPVDMAVAGTFDYTDPNYGPILQPNSKGVIYSTTQAFMGQVQSGTFPTLTNTSLDNLITRNVAQNGNSAIPRVGYTRATGDQLIHWAHEPLLASAMSTAGISSKYFSYSSPTIHDFAINEFRSTDILGFLNSATVASGAPTGFATWKPKVVVS